MIKLIALLILSLATIFILIIRTGMRNATTNRYYQPRKMEIVYRKKLVAVLKESTVKRGELIVFKTFLWERFNHNISTKEVDEFIERRNVNGYVEKRK